MPSRLQASMAMLLVLAVSLSCSLLRPKPKLTWHLLLEIDAPASEREAALRQAILVLEKRLSAAGVKNWAIKEQGSPTDGRILVSLPQANDPQRLKNLLTTGGKLELFHVISSPSPALLQTYDSKEEATLSMNGPANRRVLPYTERPDPGNAPTTKWVVVESPAIVTGSDLRDASAEKSSYGPDYEIRFSLNKLGAKRFGDWTGANLNQYLGVVLNDEVRSIAYIKSQISDEGVISGRFTKQSAEDLALVLKSGALPAPVKIVQERSDK